MQNWIDRLVELRAGSLGGHMHTISPPPYSQNESPIDSSKKQADHALVGTSWIGRRVPSAPPSELDCSTPESSWFRYPIEISFRDTLRGGTAACVFVAGVSASIVMSDAFSSTAQAAYRGAWSGLVLGCVPSVVLASRDTWLSPEWFTGIATLRTVGAVFNAFGTIIITQVTAGSGPVLLLLGSQLVAVAGASAIAATAEPTASNDRDFAASTFGSMALLWTSMVATPTLAGIGLVALDVWYWVRPLFMWAVVPTPVPWLQ